MLEPLTHKHEDYNYAFLRRMIENIKQTRDAQCPDDESANKVHLFCCILVFFNLQTLRIDVFRHTCHNLQNT